MAPGHLNAFGVIFVHQHQLVVRFQKYLEKCSQVHHDVSSPTGVGVWAISNVMGRVYTSNLSSKDLSSVIAGSLNCDLTLDMAC